MFSGGTSKTMASLYTGFKVFLFVDVFLFFSLRPSHISETFTYGSVNIKEAAWKDIQFPDNAKGITDSKKYSFLITRCTRDIHGLQIASLYHGNSQSARRGQVTEGEHQISEVHVILKENMKHVNVTIDFIWVL